MAYFVTYTDSMGHTHYAINIWNDVLKSVTSLLDLKFTTDKKA